MPQPDHTPAELRWRAFQDGKRCLVPIMTLGYLRLIESGYATFRKEGRCLEVWATPLARDIIKRAFLQGIASDSRLRERYDELRRCFSDEEHAHLKARWEAFLREYYGY